MCVYASHVYASHINNKLNPCLLSIFKRCVCLADALHICFAYTLFMQGRRDNCAFPPIARGTNRSLSNRWFCR